ncbi:sugar phosphate isomerase/epimerase family protein [Hominifimenecus sp. rT4P-3]|uniref:sugar phosphate isomerase/epimerase family protein n=1 Tax=Hominifimenecus sp. rT4P-3 TaxID=3242979 RepID=UPI003DA1E110
MLKIGVNTPLLKENIAEFGIYETMRKVSEIGYHYIEVSQVPINEATVKEFKRAQDDFGIQVCSISVDAEPAPETPDGAHKMNVRDDLDAIRKACETLGCKHCRTFSAGTDDFASLADVLKYTAQLEQAAKRLEAVGLDYSYHPHNIEFAKFGGKTGMHIMREESEALKFELCTYWIQAGGLDSERLTREFGADGRVAVMHLKDFRVPPIDTKEWLEIWKHLDQNLLTARIQFAEAGEGNLDIPGIISAGDDVGAEYIFLEQDLHYGKSEMEILQKDYENLCRMGYNDRM